MKNSESRKIKSLDKTPIPVPFPTRSGERGKPIILDGALGTELERRGFETTLPLWSAKALIEAPGLVWEIHKDYVEAGADVITTCTFRTTPYTLRKVGLEQRVEELTHQAVRYARAATTENLKLETRNLNQSRLDSSLIPPPSSLPQVAGSIAPLENCYHPELAPSDTILRNEHARFAMMLADAGVDLILVETQNSGREAVIATEAAIAAGLPVWTSLMPKSVTEMFNGDSLAETAKRVHDLGAEVILINCARPGIAAGAFGVLAKTLPDAKLGLYPNLLDQQVSDHTPPCPPAEAGGNVEEFAEWLSRFAIRASVLGGCCGTTPEHIRELAATVGHQSRATSVR